MNLEKMNNLSGLEKVKSLKQEQELKRQETENQKKLTEEQEKQAKISLYQSEKSSLNEMTARKDEIGKRLEQIKSHRQQIIDTGHSAVEEARKEPEVEKILHSKEGFDDVFSSEKEQWQNLRGEVTALNEELNNLKTSIPEKEKHVTELFFETPEGKEELRNEQGKKYIELPREGYLGELNRGEKYASLDVVMKTSEFNKLPDEARAEIKDNILSYLDKELDQEYFKKNKTNGVNAIGEDVNRVEEFVKESRELKPEIDKFVHKEVPKMIENYTKLFDKNNKFNKELLNTYRMDNCDERSELMVSLKQYGSKKVDEQLLKIKEELISADIDKAVPNPKIVKNYISKSREVYNKTTESVANNDFDTFKNIYNRENFTSIFVPRESNGQAKLFGESFNDITYSLYHKDYERLIRNNESQKLNLPYSELKNYYNQIIEKQQKQKEALLSGFSASLEMISLSGGNERNIENKEAQLKNLVDKKNEAQIILGKVGWGKGMFKGILDEEISFSSEVTGRDFNIPMFTSEVKEIEESYNEFKQAEIELERLKNEVYELKNKKVGFFESKSKHQENVNEAERVIINKENNRNYLKERYNRIANKKADDTGSRYLSEIFEYLNNFSEKKMKGDWRKDIQFDSHIKFGSALSKIEDYLNPIANQEIPLELQETVNKYQKARQKFEEAKREVFSLQQK
jgi:hypothetical protein